MPQEPPQKDPLGILGTAPTKDAGDDPLGILKKKDDTISNSPSDSLPIPTKSVTPSATSVSSSDLHQNIFGTTENSPVKISTNAVPADKKKADDNAFKASEKRDVSTLNKLGDVNDKTPVNPNLFADEKGSLIDRATQKALEKAKSDKEKQSINMKKNELTNSFFNGDLKGEDIDYISKMVSPDEHFNQGLTDETIANAINNKTKNLRVWSNISVMKGVDDYKKQLDDINKQMSELQSGSETPLLNLAVGSTPDQPVDNTQKIKALQTQKDFLQHSITQVYNAEKSKAVPKIISDLKNTIHSGKDWDQIMDESYHAPTKEEEAGLDRPYQDRPDYFIEYNPKTNTLTKESTQSILKYTSDWANKNKNPVLQVGQFGGKEDGDYTDLGKSVVNYLNTQPVIDHHNKSYSTDFNKKNKEYAPLIDHQQQIRDYFTPENVKAAEAVVKPYQDKQFIVTQEKYFGKSGVITTNSDFVQMQHKYSEAVGNKELTEDVAKKQIQAEIETNPKYQKLYKQFKDEISSIQDKGQKMYADFLTKGIEASVDPNLVIYPSGNVGVKGKSEAQSREAMKQYNQGLVENTASVIHNQNEALGLDANQRAERQGAFGGSLKQAQNEMMGAMYNWYFHKTGWDGDNARMFQAQNLAETPVTQSDVAKAWNWDGMKSLLNPKFYASKVASMIPIMAPAAITTALTEGAGAPEAIQWVASAGTFTAQDALSFRDQLTNTTDKFGNKLSDSEADNMAAHQAAEEYLPNLAFMAINLGTLSRAKDITKPTLGGAIKRAVAGAAEGTVPMAVQGYLTYANQMKAQGKTPDPFDYLQDDHFATSMIDGFIGGGVLQLAHVPSQYAQSLKNWKTMVAHSEGEFRDNTLYNVALQHQMREDGQAFRDSQVFHLFNNFSKTPTEKANLENLLQYTTALERNLKADKTLDPQNVHDLYQAHNLALADLHDNLAEQNKGNKNLSKIYADQAKDYREQAKSVVEGKAKFHYLIDGNNEPIFLSDNSLKHLDANGDIAKWLDKGVINGIHSSDDPNFDRDYKQGLKEQEDVEARAPFVPKLEPENHETIINALKEHRGDFSKGGEAMFGIHLDDPTVHEELANTIISQAVDHQGNMRDAIGQKAFNKIKPIIDEQIELKKEEALNPEEKKEDISEEKKEESDSEYKPNIRDDYFARADFFTPEEKEQYEKLDDAGKDKMIDDKRAELSGEVKVVNPSDNKPPNIVPLKKKISVISPSDNKPNEVIPLKKEDHGTDAELEKALPDTLSPEEKRGAISGGEANAEFTILTGAVHRASEAAKSRGEKLSREKVIESEANHIRDYAKENGYWINKNFGEPDENGMENDVYFSPDGKTATKVTTNPIHDTWNEFFHRIAVHNSLFPNTKYTLKGFTEHNGELAAVMDQPFVQGETANYEDVKDDLKKSGFEPMYPERTNPASKYIFKNKDTGVVLSDLHAQNVIKSKSGELHYIDPVIDKEEPNENFRPTNLTDTEIDSKSNPKQASEALKESVNRLEAEGDNSPELQKMKDRISELENPPPPKEPPPTPVRKTSENPKEEFTAVRKEKQEEIAGAKELFDQQKQIKWSGTYDNALHNVQNMYPGKNLYDAMKSRVDHFATMLENKKLYNPTSEDIAVFNVYKNQTMAKMASIEGFDSPDEIQRLNAGKEYAELQNELLKIVRVNNPGGEAGRAFNLLQSEIANNPQYGLQIRRMELQSSKGGGKLSDKDLEYTSDQWEKERALIERENELKQKAMQEKFDRQIAKLSKDRKPSTAKEKRENLLQQKGEELAAKLRSGKLKGTYATFPGLPQAINVVIEGLAKLVEAGATLAQAISNYAKSNGIEDESKFQDDLFGILNKQEKKEDAYSKIEELSKAGATDVANDMVAKNLIRDYVNNHIGIHDQKDILDIAYNGLKEILPDLEKPKLIEAYLKENEFRQPTKKQLSNGEGLAKKQLQSIAKLEEDLSDLKGYKEVRQRSFPTERERSNYEKSLVSEKEDIIRDRLNKKTTLRIEYRNLESERNRQQKKISELQTRKEQLEKGIIEKGQKNVSADTPEIEKLKSDIKDLERGIREAEAARKEADRKIVRDRNSQIKSDNQKLETERNRQLKKVSDLTDKKNQLEQGIREKREVNKRQDTPEIEDLKKQVAEADKNLREAESEVRRINRKADKKTADIAQLNTDIQRVKSGLDLQKRGKIKSVPEIDKDIESKEKELHDVMTNMGIKSSSDDKYTKASYNQRATAHNDRLENLSKKIQDKISAGNLSENALKQLQNLKGKIDASKVKLDPNSALSQEKTLQGANDLLKSIKSEFSRNTTGDILKIGDINRDLQRSIDKFNSDKDQSTQDVKLQRAKDKARNETEEFKRKIAAGEYEDNPIVDLTKTDAELLKIQRDRDLIADDFYKRKREYEKENRPLRKKIGDLARASEVTYLISGPLTYAKVIVSALTKPLFETASKLTAGKLFEVLPFSTTKAIVERAKAGGESLSMKAIAKGHEAYLKQYTPKQLEDRYKKYSDSYEKSESEYVKMKSDPNTDPKKLAELKQKKDNDLIDAINNTVYQYIGGSSVREAMEVLLHRSTSLERELGHFDRESWNKKDGILDLDNLEYVMNFVGRSHAMLKNFSARYQFASGFAARVESAVRNGEFISNPDKILELAHQSYIDWDRGKYQQSNWLSDTWNKWTNATEKVSPELAFLMRSDIAITRVPVNMIWEGIMDYTLGAFRGSIMAAREYYKAKGMVLQDGYTPEGDTQFKTELQEQLKNMDPNTAATVLRSFRKGGFGLGLYALALLGGASFGGWAHKGQTAENKAKKKREEETGTPEIKVGEIKIGNWVMPDWAAKVTEHTSAFAPLGFGLGLSQVYKNNIEDGKTTSEAAFNSAKAQIDHIIGSIPQLDKVVVPAVGRIAQSVEPSGQWDDVDQQGNPMKRQAFDIGDYFKYLNVPYLPTIGDKTNILSEHYYKQAVKNQKYYREQITRVETNTSLPQKEKDDMRKQYLQELDESTKEIYRLNKENPQ